MVSVEQNITHNTQIQRETLFVITIHLMVSNIRKILVFEEQTFHSSSIIKNTYYISFHY